MKLLDDALAKIYKHVEVKEIKSGKDKLMAPFLRIKVFRAREFQA